jgi:probable rRNA maturation factor
VIARARRTGLPEIRVRNLQRKVRVNLPALQRFAERALPLCLQVPSQGLSLNRLREIFVLLISDRRMAVLHRQFLGKRGPTDVITFEHGEIFVSVETARRQAREFGNSVLGELQLYIVHGLLHLLGLDDRDKASARKMAAMQRRVLVNARKR